MRARRRRALAGAVVAPLTGDGPREDCRYAFEPCRPSSPASLHRSAQGDQRELVLRRVAPARAWVRHGRSALPGRPDFHPAQHRERDLPWRMSTRPRPHLLPLAARCRGRAAGEARLRGGVFPAPGDQPDAIAVVDTDPDSATYATVVGFTELPHRRRAAPLRLERLLQRAVPVRGRTPHGDRRYLVVPGIRSVADLHPRHQGPDPASPQVVKVLEPEELGKRASYSRPHTVHCGPGYLYVSLPRRLQRQRGPGRGRAARPHQLRGARPVREVDRGDQYLAYDVWWHIDHDVLVTSEWGTPSMIEDGIDAGAAARPASTATGCTSGTCARAATSRPSTWATSTRWRWSCGPPTTRPRQYGFVGVVVSVEDLSASIWLWHRAGRPVGGDQGHLDPRRARPGREAAARAASRSARFRRWSPTSTCPSTTGSCTCPAGAPAS